MCLVFYKLMQVPFFSCIGFFLLTGIAFPFNEEMSYCIYVHGMITSKCIFLYKDPVFVYFDG